MIVSVIANPEPVGVLSEHLHDALRASSVIVGDESNRRGEVVSHHHATKCFEIQKAILGTKQRVVYDERSKMLAGVPALLAEEVAQGHGKGHEFREELNYRGVSHLLVHIYRACACQENNLRFAEPRQHQEGLVANGYRRSHAI